MFSNNFSVIIIALLSSILYYNITFSQKSKSAQYERNVMVKQIVKDVFFLSQKSEPATQADLQTGRDLIDTLKANRERCVGMAANMIIRK